MSGQRSKDERLSTEPVRGALEEEADLPPVVARMVVEIRSDGTRTMVRGGLEDLQTGQRVSVQGNAATPLELAKELSKSILATPTLAASMAKQSLRTWAKDSLGRLKGRKRSGG